jgi:hypothetical protein
MISVLYRHTNGTDDASCNNGIVRLIAQVTFITSSEIFVEGHSSSRSSKGVHASANRPGGTSSLYFDDDDPTEVVVVLINLETDFCNTEENRTTAAGL